MANMDFIRNAESKEQGSKSGKSTNSSFTRATFIYIQPEIPALEIVFLVFFFFGNNFATVCEKASYYLIR